MDDFKLCLNHNHQKLYTGEVAWARRIIEKQIKKGEPLYGTYYYCRIGASDTCPKRNESPYYVCRCCFVCKDRETCEDVCTHVVTPVFDDGYYDECLKKGAQEQPWEHLEIGEQKQEAVEKWFQAAFRYQNNGILTRENQKGENL